MWEFRHIHGDIIAIPLDPRAQEVSQFTIGVLTNAVFRIIRDVG